MKKILLFGIASCLFLLVTFINIKLDYNSEKKDVPLKNLLAMFQAQGESAGMCQAIFNVTYSGSVGTDTSVSVSCTTGGNYKCPLCLI